jgi:hypothetical protein
MTAMKLALEHVRRMRGGAQAQLMRCDDEAYYIVKFQNNPQHLRILANEMLATRLAARLGLCVPQVEVVEVRPELIAATADLVIQLGFGRAPCVGGKQFGSQFPGHPARLAVYDFLPDEQLGGVKNLSDFLGVLVFDKWTCNTNGRQAIFFRDPGGMADRTAPAAGDPAIAAARPPESATGPFGTRSHATGGYTADGYTAHGYTAMMIDFGFCFNAGEWDFPDAPLRGLYARQSVYAGVSGMEAFEPWLARLESRITERVLGEEAAQIPPEWYAGDYGELERLLERLCRRRERVRELLYSARNSGREPFPNWRPNMPDETLQTCSYHVVRYQPNLIRDEWVNIGVLLLVPNSGPNGTPERGPNGESASGRVLQRWLDEPADLARLRRLHPAADEELLLHLPAEFERQFAGREMEAESMVQKFDQTFSTTLQLAPRKGLLSHDPLADVERLYREQVEPVREARRAVIEIRTRGDVRARAADYFRNEKILRFMQRGVRVEEFTAAGDPMRIDFAYRRNGTRGFVHSVALGRDPGQAKLLAYTAGAIRERVAHAEFLAVTEREPARGNPRDRFVAEILGESGVRVVPLAELRGWAHEVAPLLRAEGA